MRLLAYSTRLAASVSLRRMAALTQAYKALKHIADFDRGRGFASRWREKGECELISRSGLFDAKWYVEQYPEVRRSGLAPIVHYLREGGAQGRNPCPLFA